MQVHLETPLMTRIWQSRSLKMVLDMAGESLCRALALTISAGVGIAFLANFEWCRVNIGSFAALFTASVLLALFVSERLYQAIKNYRVANVYSETQVVFASNLALTVDWDVKKFDRFKKS